MNGDTRAALAERHRTGAAQARAAASHQRHSVKVRHRHIEVSGALRKLFAARREDVEQHDFLVEHGRPMPEAARKIENVAGAKRPVSAVAEHKADAALLDDRHLFVNVVVRRGRDSWRKGQAADHQRVAIGHLADDTIAQLFFRDGVPVPRLMELHLADPFTGADAVRLSPQLCGWPARS